MDSLINLIEAICLLSNIGIAVLCAIAVICSFILKYIQAYREE